MVTCALEQRQGAPGDGVLIYGFRAYTTFQRFLLLHGGRPLLCLCAESDSLTCINSTRRGFHQEALSDNATNFTKNTVGMCIVSLAS